MKTHKIIFLICSLLALSACDPENIPEEKAQGKYPFPETKPDNVFNIAGNNVALIEVEQDSLIRNPCMGWGLYDDAQDYVADAFVYWLQMDEYAKYATHLYVRWRWAELEPEEGQYAWLDKKSN
ncbi:MAG: hypothetical protein LBT78_02300, partial [Tannerella sp.]|nr:hypothetical protein [Tannerella sp.]